MFIVGIAKKAAVLKAEFNIVDVNHKQKWAKMGAL